MLFKKQKLKYFCLPSERFEDPFHLADILAAPSPLVFDSWQDKGRFHIGQSLEISICLQNTWWVGRDWNLDLSTITLARSGYRKVKICFPVFFFFFFSWMLEEKLYWTIWFLKWFCAMKKMVFAKIRFEDG